MRRLDNLNSLQRVVKGSLANGMTSYWDGDMPEEEPDKVATYNSFTKLLPTLQPPDQLRAKERHRQWNFWHKRAQGHAVDEPEETFNMQRAHSERFVFSEDTELSGDDVIHTNGDRGSHICSTPIKRYNSASVLDLQNGKNIEEAPMLPSVQSSSLLSTDIVVSPYQVNIERRFSKFLKPTRADIIRREKHRVRARRANIKSVSLPELSYKPQRSPGGKRKSKLCSMKKKVPPTTPVHVPMSAMSFSVQVEGIEVRNIDNLK